ncbi:leucine-rich repeat-containing protein [Tanacetum coccineum]
MGHRIEGISIPLRSNSTLVGIRFLSARQTISKSQKLKYQLHQTFIQTDMCGCTAAHVGAAHTCIDKERQALLDFKAPLFDPDDMLSTWRPEEEDECCRWSGVWCNNKTGHVTAFDLNSYGLGGEISLSLLNLTYLNHLDLYGNSFHGNIPNENQFTGTIPESICLLTNLTTLDLGGNNFNGIILRSIGSLTKLTSLNLAANNFYGTIPREFGNLTKLTSLSIGSLRSCRVENLDWLSSLSSLEELKMDGISLAKANNWVNVIIGLQNLTVLSLAGCELSHVMHPYSPSVNSSSSIHYLFL